MQECKELELIRISANQITNIPDWLLKLPKLSWFACSSNPLSSERKGDSDIALLNISQIKWSTLSVHEKLGEGASSHVYRCCILQDCEAENRKDQDNFALKLFKGQITSDGLPEHEIEVCKIKARLPSKHDYHSIKYLFLIDIQAIATSFESFTNRRHRNVTPRWSVRCNFPSFTKSRVWSIRPSALIWKYY